MPENFLNEPFNDAENITLDDAISLEQDILPSDDPKLDPISMSDMTAAQKIPSEHSITMDDAIKQYRITRSAIEGMTRLTQPKERTLGETIKNIPSDVVKGVGDAGRWARDFPDAFDAAIYRAFDGYLFPNMTEDEAFTLVNESTRLVSNERRDAAIYTEYTGGPSVARNLSAMGTRVLADGLLGAMTGGVGFVVSAGVSEATELSQDMAEDYIAKHGGSLKGYKGGKDAVFAAAHGALSAYIEKALGVERMFTGAVSKMGIRGVGSAAVKGALGEGAEEFLQEGSKFLFANMAGRNNRTYGEFIQDALTNAVYGAILGGTFGTVMYYPNRARIRKALKEMGYSDEESNAIATAMIEDAKTETLHEVFDRLQIRNRHGDQYDALQDKIVSALESAGWRETNPDIDLRKYAADNADDIGRKLIMFADKYGIAARDMLNLADIDVIDNVLYLNTGKLGTADDIAESIKNKQASIKRLTELARTGAGNPELKKTLQTQVEILQKRYAKLTGDRFIAARRNRAAKARADAEVLISTAPAVSETISNIDTSKMTSGEPTIQIQERMDGQPFVYVGDKQLPVEYKVIPQSEIVQSHIGQEANPNYSLKELQNRAQRGSRTDVSILQSRAAKIQPENLGIAYNTQNGAPIINEKGEVIAGNGRAEVIRMTDAAGRARYNKYLESLGLDLTGIKDPILVRVLHGLTPEEQIAVADASNVSATSAFDNASQAVQDAKLLTGTTGMTEFLNKIPIESRQGLFLANDRVNKVALERRYNDALMMWLLNNDTQTYEDLYLMGGITQKVQTALFQSIPALMTLENQYPAVGIRNDLANALRRYPTVARADDFATTVSRVAIDDANTNLFNENALLYALVFGKNTKTWEGKGADRLQVGLTLTEFFDTYTTRATTNQENLGQTDIFGQPLAAEQTSADILAETLTTAFPREFEEGTATSRDMRAVFLTRAQTAPNPTQLSQMDLLDTVQPTLFPDNTSTASAVKNLPWERPVNVIQPIFFNRMPDRTDIDTARNNGYDSFLILNKNDKPTQIVLLDGSVVGLQKGAKIPSGAELYKPTQSALSEQASLAVENARLDDIYPEYTGETINIDGKERTVYNSNGDRIAKSEPALRNFWAWFGDSKVVDDQGRPLVVYHGTNTEFAEFDISKSQDGNYGRGFYFTNNKTLAKHFSRGGKILPVYLKIINPYNMGSGDNAWAYNTSTSQMAIKKYGNNEEENYYKARNDVNKILKDQGYDGLISDSETSKEYIVFESNQIKSTDNRGTFSPDTGNIYKQGRRVNGFYDPELEVIVLGRNSNTGTLPHEMAHFWANTLFNLVKSGKYDSNPEFLAQAMGMFKMLGVGMNQTTLTRDQQEQFASMTEAVIFGMAPVPTGAQLPMTAFLNWIPSKYKSILDIGYRNSEGRIVNPILDQQAVDWFNAWYANGALPAIDESPLVAGNSNANTGDRILPSSSEVMKTREAMMTEEAEKLRLYREEQTREATEATPTSERAEIAGARVMIESEPDNIERSQPPAEKKRSIVSALIPGRGTNTREGMFQSAYEYIAKDRAHAEEVAFGNPNEVVNDTGIDRAILIRALMENYSRGDAEYAQLYHNLAETVSLAGKTPGLSNDMNFQYYLQAVRQITDGLEGRAAVKYAGTRNLNKARRTFNSDIDAFIQERANDILRAGPDTQLREAMIKKMFAEAAVKFGGDESSPLFQEDLSRARRMKSSEKALFTEWANREIRKMLKAAPDTTMINEIMAKSEKAEKARKFLDSNNIAEAEAAAKTIREWQMYVADKQVPSTWLSRMIGSWYPKAMLYNINTHSVNMTGNLINEGLLKAAVAIQYKHGNKVSKAALQAEKNRLHRLYNTSLVNIAAMVNPTSPTLLHGEQYNPREGKSTIGKIADFSMDLLGKEDAIFRIRAYLDALGHIATADAAKTGQDPTALFNEYKKINNPKDSRAYAARMEALNISDIAVFQQTGVLSTALKKMRDALNRGNQGGLGTLLAPFVKTPANIVEQGVRAVAAPITSTYHAMQGKWSIQDTLNSGYFVLGCILALGLMEDYEPPYETPHPYDPDKPYDSIKLMGTNAWIKLDTFAAASIPMRILASLATGKGLGIAGSADEVPLLGDLHDAYKQTQQFEQKPYEQGVRFLANFAYNRANTAVPAIIRYTLAAAHPADLDLEDIDVGLPKTGIGRKIGRQYGLAGGDTTTNDILRIFFNRLRIVEE